MKWLTRLLAPATVGTPTRDAPKPRSFGTREERKVRNAEICRLFADRNVPSRDIAARFGLTQSAISQIAAASGVTRGASYRFEEKIARANATDENREATARRDQEVLTKYQAGVSSVALGIEYDVSRERICQILRRSNAISTKQQRDRLAKEAVDAETEEIVSQAKRERKTKIDAAVELVRNGRSIRMAAGEAGLKGSHAICLIGLACAEAKIKSTHGRWRDFSERETRVRALYAEGKNCTQIVRIMNNEGISINSGWISRNCPDLKFKHFRGWYRTNNDPIQEKSGVSNAPPPSDVVWSNDNISELKRLWFQGVTAQQAADILGVSRNAILGKLDRLRKNGQLAAPVEG